MKKNMQAQENQVLIPLTLDEAIVIFELLQRYSNNEVLSIEDQAEQRALWNLCCVFEKHVHIPFDGSFKEIVAAARSRLRD